MSKGRKVVIMSSSVILLLLLGGALYNRYFLRTETPSSAFSNTLSPTNCSNGKPVHPGLAHSTEPSLAKLAEYETVCHGSVVDRLMLFAAMPTTLEEARQQASHMASQLHALAAADIAPLVVFEPPLNDLAVLQVIHTGAYDAALQTYFNALKGADITDRQMGTWVVFPEANTPIWNTTSAELFRQNVTKVARMQKNVFPSSKVSLMLNSRSYPSADTSWNHGELRDLAPYVTTLPHGLIDNFGLQGFPFASPANTSDRTTQLNAPDFLPARLVISAAIRLGIHDIWFNTGTFGRRYTDDPAAQITLTPSQRQTTLDSILAEVETTKNAGFSVSVNLFAADKSADTEHTDWSYWPVGQMASSSATTTFDAFVRKLRQQGIGLSLYDYKP